MRPLIAWARRVGDTPGVGQGMRLWRMIAGIGIGVELVTIDTYVVELVPKHIRGRTFAFNPCVQFAVVPVVATRDRLPYCESNELVRADHDGQPRYTVGASSRPASN